MVLLPVIQRELRASARQPSTFTMRMLSVFALLAATIVFGFTTGFGPKTGGDLFVYAHRVLLLAVWVLVPFLAADSISRERREGTLPLLSLTALRPMDVAIAKMLVHGLRAFTLWLAVLPVLAIPILMGGVGKGDMLYAVVLHFTSLTLALGCGMVASAFSRRFVRAQALTGLLAFFFAILMAIVLGVTTIEFLGLRSAGMAQNFEHVLEVGVAMALTLGTTQWQLLSRLGSLPKLQVMASGALLVLSVFSLWMVTRVAAWRVRASWKDTPPSRTWLRIQDVFCRPMFFQNWLKRWMKKRLQANPIGWLEHRTWNGRLVMWSWMAVVVSIYSYMVLNFDMFMRGFGALQTFLATLLALSMAFSAAGSFRRERETGVLELLLVSPLKEDEIIWGRLRGLYQQFAPALVLLFGVWLYCGGFLLRGLPWIWLLGWMSIFCTLPLIGLFFSLAQSNFIGAFLRTLIIGLVLPLAVASILDSRFEILGTVLAATVFGGLLRHRLIHRKFPLDRPLTS